MKPTAKRYFVLFAFLFLLSLAGCAKAVKPEEIIGTTYRYEGEGIGGEFILHLEEDGSFTYSEGGLSSYLGAGKWTLEKDILCLTDQGSPGLVNYFRVEEEKLSFRAEGSSNFIYVTVKDTENFQKIHEE